MTDDEAEELIDRVAALENVALLHERRLGKLDGHEGKDYPQPIHNVLLQGTDVDHTSPQYKSDISTGQTP